MKLTIYHPLVILFLFLAPSKLLAQVTAANDQAYAAVNRPLVINVLANDGLHICNASSITLEKVSNSMHGNVELVEGNKFKYTPNAGYVGVDYFDYKLTCSGSTATARVNILVGNLPSSFFELDCQYRPESFTFGLEKKYESMVTIDNYNAMAAGDLDGDGYTEVIAMKPNNGTHHAQGSYLTYGFYIFNHKAEVVADITFPSDAGTSYIYSTNVNSITIADLNNDGKGEILFSTVGRAGVANYKLLVYDYQGNLKATSAISTTPFRNTVGVADFDNDGYPEIYAGTSIYRYTGSGLVELYKGVANIHSTAQDIDNDGIPEIITPQKTYKVSLKDLTGTGSGANINTVTEYKAAGYTEISSEGYVFALADVDLDGQIEVVTVVPTPTHLNLHIWDAATGAAKYTVGAAIAGGGLASSFPFIGDSDGDGYPDIAFMGGNSGTTGIFRFGYNKATKKVEQKGVVGTGFQDFSSRITGLTMFDFNLDSKMEIVYRDELALYILDGTDFSIIHKEENNRSGTLREYPLIVSLTPSGESYVLINSSNTGGQVGTLRIYGSNSTPWAPSRSVWNQFAFYQNIVDDNLKVIANPLPLNFKMENESRVIYPFNGHEIQLGPIDANTLEFVRPAPNLGISGINYSYNVETDVLAVKITMVNTGSTSMDNPIPIETYKVEGSTKTLLQTNSCTDDLLVGTPLVYTYTIANYSTLLPMDRLEVVVAKLRIDCEPDNNTGDFTVKLRAVKDYAETDVNVAKTIRVIDNDELGDCNSADITVQVEGIPSKGSAIESGKDIIYTPATDNIGAGKFYYTIICNGDSSTGWVDVVTKGDVMVEKEDDASEPTIFGRFKIRFKGSITCDNDVKVFFTVDAPGLTEGQDFTVNPTGFVIITKGQNSAFVTITPKDNYVVEGNVNKVNITIVDVELIP